MHPTTFSFGVFIIVSVVPVIVGMAPLFLF